MAFMTSSAQNLEQVPPHSVNIRDISISAELSSIPRLQESSKENGCQFIILHANMRYTLCFRVTFNASLLQQKLIDLSIY
jgi:hypothetical protein